MSGLDLNPIAVEVTGQPVFTGASPFANWDGTTTGAAMAWTPVTITIPRELLQAGRNRITIANLSPSVTVGFHHGTSCLGCASLAGAGGDGDCPGNWMGFAI